ncbi:MAG: DAK2 domain-containing protein [Anaerolineae bacterium]|nr:DAK2 domain-containing protein [Anaerolineae bacterium]
MSNQPENNTSLLASPQPIIVLNSACLSRMIAAGVVWFERNYETINQLNVFPVPDGDTGTNMLHTLRAAYKRMNGASSQATTDQAAALATGAIYGSRGNSGTLLSQMFDGFAKALHGHTEIDAKALAKGFREAVQLAYRALQEPKEGTILTVAREIAEEVEDASQTTNDLKTILERIVERGSQAVKRTPELLPILKKAGVVDSGGQGLVVFFEGMLRALRGEPVAALTAPGKEIEVQATPVPSNSHNDPALRTVLTADDERGYGYDVQYIISGQNLDVDQIRRDIAAMGDSMVVVGDPQVVKVHIHVHDPGVPISYGVKLGVIQDVVVENMQEQSEGYIAMREAQDDREIDPAGLAAAAAPTVSVVAGEVAVIAVAPGEGLREVFFNLGAATVISGGATMNPSVEEFIEAINNLPTDKFVLLPNDKNVVLAAKQAARLATQQDKRVIVVPTISVPQGIGAMFSFNPRADLTALETDMHESAESIVTGEITIATRAVELDGVQVRNGQFIGLVNGSLVSAADQLRPLLLDVLEKMNVLDYEIVTLYYGTDISAKEAEATCSWLQERYGSAPEFTVISGGQPHYHYILSAE